MTEFKKHNYLKTEKYKDLAHKLMRIKTDIELMRATSELFPSMDRMNDGELAVHYYKTQQYLEIIFSKFQDIENDLDDVGSILYAVDDYKDLKEFVRLEDLDLPKDKK